MDILLGNDQLFQMELLKKATDETVKNEMPQEKPELSRAQSVR